MTHTPGPWTASWAENGIAALRDSEGKHFANFRNVRGDEISTVNADLAVVVAAPEMLDTMHKAFRALCEMATTNPCLAGEIALVKATIAKAEGGAA